MNYLIDTMKFEDWNQVRSIYHEGISTGHSTFESEAPGWEKWDSTHLPEHRLVAREDDRILAWAALTPVSYRMVYSGVAEISLYVGAGQRGRGWVQPCLRPLYDHLKWRGYGHYREPFSLKIARASTWSKSTVSGRSEDGRR